MAGKKKTFFFSKKKENIIYFLYRCCKDSEEIKVDLMLALQANFLHMHVSPLFLCFPLPTELFAVLEAQIRFINKSKLLTIPGFAKCTVRFLTLPPFSRPGNDGALFSRPVFFLHFLSLNLNYMLLKNVF